MATQTAVGPQLRVRDIMQHEVVTLPADATTSEAARLLWTRQISGAPVLDDAGRVVGVVSGMDLLAPIEARGPEVPEHAAAHDNREKEGSRYFLAPDAELLAGEALAEAAIAQKPEKVRVRDVMTPATYSVRADATIPELARFMLHAGVHRALVLEGEALTGIVTTFDVLRAVSGELVGAAR